jgi:hypothetical protein
MQYQPVELLRGVWGLEDRLYTANEIAQSFHLQSAVRAGALSPVEPDSALSADKSLPRGEIDLSDGVADGEARLAAQALRQRRKEKE